jgi:TonB family protein
MAASVLAQAPGQSDQERAEQAALNAVRSRDIPEATLPCTPEETKWWNDLRAAGKAIRPARGAKKQRDDFIRLIKEGIENSYQVPIADRSAIVLWREPPRYTDEARNKRINGSVAMAVELRPDGSVGEVRIAQSLDQGLDEMATTAARKAIFLPMVKARKFVSIWLPMTMEFNIY